MATFKQNLRESFEESSGLLGQTLRAQRKAQEKEEEIQQELGVVHQTTDYVRQSAKSLSSIEVHLLQIAKNFQAINKSMGVYAELFDLSNKTEAEHMTQMAKAREQQLGADKVTVAEFDKLPPVPAPPEESGFSLLDSLFDIPNLKRTPKPKPKPKVKPKERIKNAGKKAAEAAKKKGLDKAGQNAAKEEAERKAKQRLATEAEKKAATQAEKKAATGVGKKAAGKAGAGVIKKAISGQVAKKLGGLLAKSIPFVGVAAGIGFAVSKMIEGDWVGAGIEAASGLGGPITSIPATIAAIVRDTYLEVYGVRFEDDPERGTRLPELTKMVEESVKEALTKKAKPEDPEKANQAMQDEFGLTSPEEQNAAQAEDKKKGGFFSRLFGSKQKEEPQPAAPVAKTTALGSGIKPGGGVGLKMPQVSGDDASTMAMIKDHEGVSLKPYKDSLGLWTIGVGHLIGDGKSLPKEWDRTLTMGEVDQLFAIDFQHHKELATKAPGWNKANSKAKAALVDLTFNMGGSWYTKFPKASSYLAKGDFVNAATEMKDSKWYAQVGRRGPRIVALLESGGAPDLQQTTVSTSTSDQSVQVAAAKMENKNQPDKRIIMINDNKQVVRQA